MEKIIDKSLSEKILMAGNYYKKHHPGGISAVIQYWSEYIDGLQYYPTWKLGNVLTRTWWFLYAYLRMVLKLLVDRRVKIVHLHFAADGSFWRKSKLLALSKLFGKKVIMHCHASRFKDFYDEASDRKKRWIRKTLQRADILIALSDSWKSWFESIGILPQHIIVLHNITSYPVERPNAKVDDGRLHLLFMGELGKRKGVFDILRALSNHKERFENKLSLRIGGNKNERELMNFIRDNGLTEMVKFEGWVGGEKKADLFNWADLFILPSFNEGLPISILEAMSYGLPIISTPVGGIPEVVNKNGILVTPGNDEEIAKSIERYIAQSDLLEQEGNYSKEMVATYLPIYVMNHLKEIYHNLLD